MDILVRSTCRGCTLSIYARPHTDVRWVRVRARVTLKAIYRCEMKRGDRTMDKHQQVEKIRVRVRVRIRVRARLP